MNTLLELHDVHAGYDGVRVLAGFNLVVPTGWVVAVLGPNGAGKTTTMRIASGQLQPVSGQVLVAGYNVTGASSEAFARAGVCLVPEGRGVLPNLTVAENVRLQSYLRHDRSPSDMEEIAYARFPVLGERRSQLAGTLSGGEQQMLALTRAFTVEPALLLLDEISTGLAPLIVEALFEVIREQVEKGTTILLVEQFVDYALKVADWAIVMNKGVIRAAGEPADLADVMKEAYLGA